VPRHCEKGLAGWEEIDEGRVDPRAEGILEAAIEIVRAKAVDLQKGRRPGVHQGEAGGAFWEVLRAPQWPPLFRLLACVF
jgi:hypothetical protein